MSKSHDGNECKPGGCVNPSFTGETANQLGLRDLPCSACELPSVVALRIVFRLIYCCILCLTALTGLLPAREIPELPLIYKATALEGYIKLAGKKFDLPLKSLRGALLKDGYVVVSKSRIPIQKVKWSEVLEKLRFKGIKGGAITSGPSDVILRKVPDGYRGRTVRPLVIVQRGKYHFIKVTVTLRTNLETEIIDGKLTMKAPVKVQALGLTANGMITLEAEQMELPPFP